MPSLSALANAHPNGPGTSTSLQFSYSFLHMHSYSKQIWSGVTTPSPAGGNLVITSDLDRANFYEFTFQHISILNHTIKRGDRINVHCIYDLSTNLFPKLHPNNTGVTFDLASEDEMCIDFSLN
ncbi:hypothetical protein BC936DRAFT_137624 [Jimgerdemannia flammicorona]|uniref:Copper type II ascorbate-dependent monooxygenase C-terminal domain-containing protein n=1 Tax=Jimgerdemannia flammicorona TaxID=994334 RepID=A0A433DN07_9FUNG|nr:hypothetical protein BC936DRAFT_137624 [Jimgerdemannia flammicorona]